MSKKRVFAALLCAVLALCLSALPEKALAEEKVLDFVAGAGTWIIVENDGGGWKATSLAGSEERGTASGAMTDSLKIQMSSDPGNSSINNTIVVEAVGTDAAPLLLTLHNVNCAVADTSAVDDPRFGTPLTISATSHVKLTAEGDSAFWMRVAELPAIAVGDNAHLTIAGGTITAMGGDRKPAIEIGDGGSVTIAPAAAKTLETRVATTKADLDSATPISTVVNPNSDNYTATEQFAQIREVSLKVSADPAGSVTVNTQVMLTAKHKNLTNPAYQWHSNTSDSTTGGTPIAGATATTYQPSTAAAGTSYYYCIASGVTSNVVPVVVTAPSSGGSSISEDYLIIRGQNGVWSRGSAAGLAFAANGDYGKFLNVWVDGAYVSGNNYTARAGSTIIEFKPEYLATLSVGRHVLRVNYIDGYAETEFTVGDGFTNVELPKTGDSPLLGLCAGMLLVAAGAFLRKAMREGAI